LAASVKITIGFEDLTIKLKNGCAAILEGYRETLGESLKKYGFEPSGQ
jgi:hypothetical protein